MPQDYLDFIASQKRYEDSERRMEDEERKRIARDRLTKLAQGMRSPKPQQPGVGWGSVVTRRPKALSTQMDLNLENRLLMPNNLLFKAARDLPLLRRHQALASGGLSPEQVSGGRGYGGYGRGGGRFAEEGEGAGVAQDMAEEQLRALRFKRRGGYQEPEPAETPEKLHERELEKIEARYGPIRKAREEKALARQEEKDDDIRLKNEAIEKFPYYPAGQQDYIKKEKFKKMQERKKREAEEAKKTDESTGVLESMVPAAEPTREATIGGRKKITNITPETQKKHEIIAGFRSKTGKPMSDADWATLESASDEELDAIIEKLKTMGV